MLINSLTGLICGYHQRTWLHVSISSIQDATTVKLAIKQLY